MKIVHISTRIKIDYGGGEKFLEQFIASFNNYEHVFIGRDNVVNKLFEKAGYKSFYSPAGFEPITPKRKLFIPISFILGIVQFIKFYKFWRDADVIIVSASSIAEPIFLLPWIKIFFPKKRLIQFIHGMCISYYYKQPLVGLLRKVWTTMEIVFVSESQKLSWENNNLVGKKNYVVYNGVKISNKPLVVRADEIVRIGYIGRMYFEKKVDILLKALSLVKPEKKVEVYLAGDGPQLKELKQLEQSLNVSKNISFKWLGFVDDTKEFYSMLDLVVFPSAIESFGLVLLEAWERGVPVITSNIPAFIELKLEAPSLERKLAFELNNISDLRDKIDYFLNNTKLYTESNYKDSLHSFVKYNFSFETMFNEYNKLLKS
ncbi:MAG: glycosyltransferase family 4 protein [Patescibacteria group bacterium]